MFWIQTNWVKSRWQAVFVVISLLLSLTSTDSIEVAAQRGALPSAVTGQVLARVTVTGPWRDALPLLREADFQLWEDGVLQQITTVAREQDGLSLGIIYSAGDVSGPRSGPRLLLENSGAVIEYFLMAGDTVVTPFSTDIRKVPPVFRPEGGALENLYVGLDVLKESAYSRRALVLIGGDLAEAPQTDYIKAQAIRQGVTIFAIMSEGIPPGPAILALDEIVSLTGGEIYYAPFDVPAAVEMYALQIAQGLRNQYRIGYQATNGATDGTWRALRVRVKNPETVRLQARVKRGRYALP